MMANALVKTGLIRRPLAAKVCILSYLARNDITMQPDVEVRKKKEKEGKRRKKKEKEVLRPGIIHCQGTSLNLRNTLF